MPGGDLILIVEDDPEVASVLRKRLELEGFCCERAENGEQALDSIRAHRPKLVLLDRVLPGLPGDEVIRRLKSDPRTQSIPVIMLTGKADESDELVGLALGADDYVAKPFSPKVLVARIGVLLRRQNASEQDNDRMPSNSIMLDRTQPRVYVDQTPVQLTAIEYKILAALIAARGHILARHQLVTMVYGKKLPSDDRVIEGQVDELRRKMGSAGGYIQSVSDHGYAFCTPPGQRPPA
jgi:DNA-binding response OmpR family regulator